MIFSFMQLPRYLYLQLSGFFVFLSFVVLFFVVCLCLISLQSSSILVGPLSRVVHFRGSKITRIWRGRVPVWLFNQRPQLAGHLGAIQDRFRKRGNEVVSQRRIRTAAKTKNDLDRALHLPTPLNRLLDLLSVF